MAVWVKICGITNVEDAELAVDAGADAIGLNFVPSSKRRVERKLARSIVDQVGGRIEVVLVVADMTRDQLRALRREVGASWLQLHGSEAPEALQGLLPQAYKAVRVRDAGDVSVVDQFGGERILVDSKVAGQLGGTGETFDHSLVVELAKRRPLIVAGGLDADNVAQVVQALGPFGVDTASGVETPGAPRKKQPERVRAFVRSARRGGGE